MGDPVTAEDGDTADVLTYTLMEESGSDGKFVIDRATRSASALAKGDGPEVHDREDDDWTIEAM